MALQGEETEFMNLREWDRRARLIRENQTSRRFSASYIGSFREDHHHNYSSSSSSKTYFNNNNNISSTASSPGYSLKEEIDPSKYSFTNALKAALQAKTMYNNREWLAQEGFALNSKWNEAEKYICNPLSGQVPLECLSSKTLSARSFRNLTTTMSPPLMNIAQQNKPYNSNNNNNNYSVRVIHEDLYAHDHVLVPDKKVVGLKREVGIQSISSGSPSPAKTPSITERSLKRHVESNDSSIDNKLKYEDQQEGVKVEEKEEEEEEEHMSKEEEKQKIGEEEEKKKKKRGSGCFTWMRLRQRQARKSKYIFPVCVPHLVKVC